MCCTNQFNTKTEDSSSNKKLEHSLILTSFYKNWFRSHSQKVVSYMRESTVILGIEETTFKTILKTV